MDVPNVHGYGVILQNHSCTDQLDGRLFVREDVKKKTWSKQPARKLKLC